MVARQSHIPMGQVVHIALTGRAAATWSAERDIILELPGKSIIRDFMYRLRLETCN